MLEMHASVMLDACVDALLVKPGGVYVDGTFGRGGHSAAILAKLGVEGCLIAFDQDAEAIAHGRERFLGDDRVRLVHANFADLGLHVTELVDGVLLDLGVSSPQIDTASRGFSFMQSGPLDMRMNATVGDTLEQKLADVSLETLTHVIKTLGEEKFARRIATAILTAQAEGVLTDTLSLANVVANAQPVKDKYKHPATRTFQVLRMWVNDELGVLSHVLSQAIDHLKPGGRLAVMSFHSLEDRMVKQFFRDQSRGKYNDVLRQVEGGARVRALGKRFPSPEEIQMNPRARSAILRVVERLS